MERELLFHDSQIVWEQMSRQQNHLIERSGELVVAGGEYAGRRRPNASS